MRFGRADERNGRSQTSCHRRGLPGSAGSRTASLRLQIEWQRVARREMAPISSADHSSQLVSDGSLAALAVGRRFAFRFQLHNPPLTIMLLFFDYNRSCALRFSPLLQTAVPDCSVQCVSLEYLQGMTGGHSQPARSVAGEFGTISATVRSQ